MTNKNERHVGGANHDDGRGAQKQRAKLDLERGTSASRPKFPSSGLHEAPTAPAHGVVEGDCLSDCSTDQVRAANEDIAEAKPDPSKTAEAHPDALVIADRTADGATSIKDIDLLPHEGETASPLVNGNETDFRMAKIQEILDHTAMSQMAKCALVAEWVRHAESQSGVDRQFVAKPGGGRPESSITRAARELSVPGRTLGARRKYVERAINIDCILPEAKLAATGAGLDNIKSALLDIAAKQSREAQLEAVQEIAARRARQSRKRIGPAEAKRSAGGALDSAGAANGLAESNTTGEEGVLAILRTSWHVAQILKRQDFERASGPVRRRFVEDMLGTVSQLHDEAKSAQKEQSPSSMDARDENSDAPAGERGASGCAVASSSPGDGVSNSKSRDV
jgi:hypothetical protein